MFFSVKRAVRIAGKDYIPCICYPITKFLERTIQKLSDEGKAVIYTERVFFQNGKVIENKPAVKENLTAEKPKKEKKERKAEVKEIEAEEAEIIPNEETDESEGF